ncbi:hypothetical protein [Saccharopolyspora sp. SCSIO 74807]|uniref:hypothetical protein n=1 Tax=Saccharopolyspora sp. SCSIO 74807 TaxID=3118084 RepID=UPI0030CAF99A
MTDWLGNLPSWVSAIVASCALIFTSWTAYNSHWSARAARTQAQIALDAQEERNEKDKSEQASKVAAWIEHRGDSVASELYVNYLNASNLPVFGLSCRLTTRTRPDTLEAVVVPSNEAKEVRYRSATEWARAYSYDLFAEVLSSLGMDHLEHEEEFGHEIERLKGACFESFCSLIAHRGIEIQFTDLAGVQWCRNSDGDLCNHGFLVELPYPDRWEWMVDMMKKHIRDGLQPIRDESQHSNLGGPDQISD